MKSNKFTIMVTEKAAQANAAAEAAIKRMIETGEVIDFTTVSKAAGVSRKYLYDNEHYRMIIMNLRTTDMTKEELRKEVFLLRLRNRQLEEAIRRIKAVELP